MGGIDDLFQPHRASLTRESVEKRRMPPWKAVAGYGDLAGERRMSEAEIATIARWVATGDPPAHAHARAGDEGLGSDEGQVPPPLIHIDDWDFNWQGFYWFRTPMALPVASWISLTAAWDNSERNPRNPNKPPRDVYWGERTVDEMGHAAILYTLDDEGLK